MNVVVLNGSLSRDPELRDLPSGDVVLSFDVTTREPGQRAEAVPVAWPAPPPSAPNLAAGDAVVVIGRVRRRFYRAGGATSSRTEVVAERVIPARQRKKARTAVEQVCEDVAGAMVVAATTPPR